MQARAIIGAACELVKGGIEVMKSYGVSRKALHSRKALPLT